VNGGPISLALTLVLSVPATPLAGEAQQAGKIWRIGVLTILYPPDAARASVAAFEQAATNCSRFSRSPKHNGKRCARRTRLSGSTKSFAGP